MKEGNHIFTISYPSDFLVLVFSNKQYLISSFNEEYFYEHSDVL